MATAAANPISSILKKATDEMAKNIVPAPELNYGAFYGTRDQEGHHPSDEVMKHIATKHYASHDLANTLKTIAKVTFFITIVIGLLQLGPYVGLLLELFM
jgi:hypothetical protein